MKRLLKLPRKKREIIGCTTVLVSLVVLFLVSPSEEFMLLMMVPVGLFFAWICPEIWDGD